MRVAGAPCARRWLGPAGCRRGLPGAGLRGVRWPPQGAFFEEGAGPILLDDLRCREAETAAVLSDAALGSARLSPPGGQLGAVCDGEGGPGGGGQGGRPGGLRPEGQELGCYVFPKLTPPGVRLLRSVCPPFMLTCESPLWWSWAGGREPQPTTQQGWWSPLSPPTPGYASRVCPSHGPRQAAAARGPGGLLPGPHPRAWPVDARCLSSACPPTTLQELGGPRGGPPRPPLNPKCGAERRFPALPQPPGAPPQRTEGRRAQKRLGQLGSPPG